MVDEKRDGLGDAWARRHPILLALLFVVVVGGSLVAKFYAAR